MSVKVNRGDKKTPASRKLKNQPKRFNKVAYQPINVVEAAKRRLRWTFDNSDEVAVGFSGGKDSLVCLELALEVKRERGDDTPIRVNFYDEELVTDLVIQFVRDTAERHDVDMHWYCLPMEVGFYIMGEHKPFNAWDTTRTWHRQPPPYAIMDVGANVSEMNENEIDRAIYPDDGQRHTTILGLRADESVRRYMKVLTCAEKGRWPNFIKPGGHGRNGTEIFTSSPIYDWLELDVFKYFKDRGIRYCPHYDTQLWARTPMRVSSTMHERAYRQLVKVQQMDPQYFDQLTSVYPEIITHVKYWGQVDQMAVLDRYSPTWDGVRDYIRDKIQDPDMQADALRFVDTCERTRERNLEADPDKPLGGISVHKVFTEVIRGRYVKASPPQAMSSNPLTTAELDYENAL